MNAHPHMSADNDVAVVHNGIIDNASDLRRKLEADGVEFLSETDTEVLVHLIARSQAETLEEKVRQALRVVEARTASRHARRLLGPDRRRPQRLPGRPRHRREGDVRRLGHRRAGRPHPPDRHARRRRDGHPQGRRLPHLHHRGTRTTAEPTTVEWEAASYDMGGHDTYMHKEIHEQADAVDRVLRGRIDDRFSTVHLGGLNLDAREARQIRRVKILGCGTSYHAGMIGAR